MLRVLESWAGDLKEGSVITIPELAAFGSEKARAITDRWGKLPAKLDFIHFLDQ